MSDINLNEAFLIKDGIIRSVSIVFYSPKNDGFLLCDEIRKGFPNPEIKHLENHLIGGKVDMDDKSPIHAGFREFCEETGFISSLSGSSSSSSSIEETVDLLVNQLKPCKKKRIDLCVSQIKKLYNRFYIINIDTLDNLELYDEIIKFILSWKKRDEIPLERIYFWNDNLRLSFPSSLLKLFLQNILPNLD